MEGVHGIESLATGDGWHHLSRTLGPVLLISMGYIDLGKWVETIDAGSRFGYDLVILVLLFNLSAILCQYLSMCIGMVTGKNLAEICREEYSPSICVILGIQAGLSLLTAELTMLSGISVGFNLVFEYDDPIAGLYFASVVVNLLPYTMSYLGQRQSTTLSLGALFHDHLFSILFIFTGVFLVNYVLMGSAAVESNNTLVTFQDSVDLMNQMFMNPMAPIVFLVILIFSSHVISLTSIIGSHAILKNFFGVNLPHSAHHLLLKAVAMVPTMYYAKVAGSEGIYQLLIICPVIQAMFLPSSVIPVFRVSSSRVIMSRYKISLYVEILAILAFLLLLFTNIIFAAEILFGDSTWTNNLKGNTGSPVVLPHAIVVLISCASITFTLFLAVTPLKSASNEPETQELSEHSQREDPDTTYQREASNEPETQELSEHSQREDPDTTYQIEVSNERETQQLSEHSQIEDPDTFYHREELSLVEQKEDHTTSTINAIPRISSESYQTSALEHNDFPDITVESGHGTQQLTAFVPIIPEVSSSIKHKEPKSVVIDQTEPVPKVCTATVVEHNTAENIKMKSTTSKHVQEEAGASMDYDTEASYNAEVSKSSGNKAPPISDDPTSLTLSKGRDSDAGYRGSNLSRLPGLGRAARRQLAAILDEFWGHLFDYHGKLTQEANAGRFNFLLGPYPKAVRSDNQAIEASRSPLMRDAIRGSATIQKSWDSRAKEVSSPGFNFVLQMGRIGSSNWSESMRLSNADIPRPTSTLFEQNTQFYSNYNVPSYPDNQFYQPATIHGYHLATSLKSMNASHSTHSSISLDPRRLPRSSESAGSNYADSARYARNQDVIGSQGTASQNTTMSCLDTMTVERAFYNPASVNEIEGVGSSAYSKKYHSSPDISALIAASRNYLPNEVNLGGAAGSSSYFSNLACERSQYVNLGSSSTAQFALSKHSQPNFHRDTSSMQSSVNPSTESIWAQQPFEQLLGVSRAELNKGEGNTDQRSSGVTKHDFSNKEYEVKLLQSLRFCIMKLLKLEGSGWLFEQNGGCDEKLIDQVAVAERVSQHTTENQLSADLQLHSSDEDLQPLQRNDNRDANCMSLLPKCGDDCVWQAPLIVSFGVWCIRQILNLCLVESRPELWGKYTYVLNRLQGILDPAFSKPQKPMKGCVCLQKVAKPISGTFTTAGMILEMIKDVEQAISSRKGRSGTAAGDVAFPKGKENLASVLKRYKRRLSNKTSAGQ
ncbi:protein ETHYLENE-INSENSITIVE 2-like isoform X2 [Oryza sativa Japonica Group]|uniref:protein ETHYLENE-INSENSITIVE 2-like isoform X2 n=1 Tax=Oryza sativa subsp. japonica TaxID=39947 RepID=UPI00077540D1|nr:protein ETHYLENE-INSENSITIVE 2-like isoform X2 [Oryza sativa Japonica Group]